MAPIWRAASLASADHSVNDSVTLEPGLATLRPSGSSRARGTGSVANRDSIFGIKLCIC